MPETVLKSRVALVTGVNRRKGIGFAIAQRLAMLGADVFIHSFSPFDANQPWGADPDGVSTLVATLQEHGTRIAHAEMDLYRRRGLNVCAALRCHSCSICFNK